MHRRDRLSTVFAVDEVLHHAGAKRPGPVQRHSCLLYTSDAADERSSVDLGGRRIIKKKNTSVDDGGARSEHEHYKTRTGSEHTTYGA